VDTLTANLSAFITSRLQPGLPATVWDPYEYTPYVQQVQKKKAPALSANGKGKGKARDSAVHSDRQDTDGDEMDGQEDLAAKAAKAATQKAERLARNPLLEKGLWQLSWHEKATILRQLVDWQCERPPRQTDVFRADKTTKQWSKTKLSEGTSMIYTLRKRNERQPVPPSPRNL
jgi:hypothetical protein